MVPKVEEFRAEIELGMLGHHQVLDQGKIGVDIGWTRDGSTRRGPKFAKWRFCKSTGVEPVTPSDMKTRRCVTTGIGRHGPGTIRIANHVGAIQTRSVPLEI